MNHWVFFALLAAFTLATADSLSKKAMGRTDELVIAWVRQGYSLPFLSISFLFINIPQLDNTFWLSLLFLVPMEVTAIILYVKAIKISPLSLTIPFMALSPVFIIITAFLMLGELPDRSGLLGIFLIVAGAYILNVKATKEGFFGPFKAIKRERGSVLMIIVALIYSLTSTIGKIAIQHSSPVFFGSFYPIILTIIFSIILLTTKGKIQKVFSRPLTFLGIGFFIAVMVLSHFTAISMADVAYMISVKRTSLIFSVIYGRLFFGERHTGERLTGSVLMVAGVVLITVF